MKHLQLDRTHHRAGVLGMPGSLGMKKNTEHFYKNVELLIGLRPPYPLLVNILYFNIIKTNFLYELLNNFTKCHINSMQYIISTV